MAGLRDKTHDDIRFRILRLLQENPQSSQRDLAAAVGISVGSLHHTLNALVDKGLIRLGSFADTRDRRRHVYLLTPVGRAEKAALTRSFLKRKRDEYDALKNEIDALEREMDLDPGRA